MFVVIIDLGSERETLWFCFCFAKPRPDISFSKVPFFGGVFCVGEGVDRKDRINYGGRAFFPKKKNHCVVVNLFFTGEERSMEYEKM